MDLGKEKAAPFDLTKTTHFGSFEAWLGKNGLRPDPCNCFSPRGRHVDGCDTVLSLERLWERFFSECEAFYKGVGNASAG